MTLFLFLSLPALEGFLRGSLVFSLGGACPFVTYENLEKCFLLQKYADGTYDANKKVLKKYDFSLFTRNSRVDPAFGRVKRGGVQY